MSDVDKTTNQKNTELLRNKKVIEEINRHQWIESEKAGYDVGFDNAANEWLEKFSAAWMDYHLPESKKTASTQGKSKAKSKKTSKSSVQPKARTKPQKTKNKS